MELVVPWLLALAWLGYRTVPNLRSRGVLLPGFLAIVCAAAALGSASKGAALLVPLSAGVILTAALRESRRKGRVLLVGAMGIALVAVALLATPVRTRVEDFIAAGGTDLSRSERFMVWKSSLPLLAEHPVLGIGFGAFRHVIPRVLPAGEPQPWLQLHNDFLEVVVSGGGVAAVLLVALILGYARRALAALRSGSPESLERFGALVGVGAVSAHALFDFGHQIPANALLFVVTAAVGVPRTDASGKRRAGTMPARFLAVALAAVSLAYTVRGTYAGLEFSRGMTDAARGEFQSAAYRLERAGLGGNGFEAAWAHGDVLMGVWDRMQVEDANSGSGADVLEKAAQRFLSSEREVAASGWPFQGLGSLYRRVERAEGGGRPFDLSWIGESPWAAVGRRGRIAIGLHRLAVQREPMVSAHHDALIVSLIELGLRQEAKEALRQAARLQPILVQHNGLDPSTIVDDFLEAFHRGAVEALSSVPMTPPQRHLLSLGQTAFRLRRYDEAESWLKKALVAPADRISRAEARVWLAYTAARQGRFDQAGQWFESTLDVPNFRGASLEGLARLANDRGDVEEELRLRDELRKENPGDSGQLVRFADAAVRAGNAPMAVQALRTASLRRPHDTDLQVSLASALLAAGDREGASAVIRQIEGLAPGDSRIPDLRRRLRSVEEDAQGRP
jgi:tetratricopeptide (TPR) repeat protein